MYCVNCGVNLADTEKKCPLCETEVYHPVIKQGEVQKLYPSGRMPEKKSGLKLAAGAGIVVFVLAIIICFFDWCSWEGVWVKQRL